MYEDSLIRISLRLGINISISNKRISKSWLMFVSGLVQTLSLLRFISVFLLKVIFSGHLLGFGDDRILRSPRPDSGQTSQCIDASFRAS